VTPTPLTVLVAHPSAELYGSDRVALESVAGLVEAGHSVVVALADEGPLRSPLEAVGARVVVVGAPVLRKNLMTPAGAARFALGTARAVPTLVRLIRSVRPDLVYVSTVTVPVWSVAARLTRRPVVCHVHEAEADLPRAVRLGLAAPLLLARAVIANSGPSRAVLVGDLPLLGRRIRVVHNGVPGPTAPGAPRRELADAVRLVLVGRISPRKGTDVAVRALALLRDRGVKAELTLVGGIFPGYEWFERQVRDEVRTEGLEDRVHWAGVLPEVWSSLAAGDVALVPSRVEPFGNAAVEAMLAGRPVVASAAQGLCEIVTPGVDGELAAPGDPEALADAVERVLADWPGALARAERARADAVRRFAPERYRADLVAVVTSAARGDTPAG
jgi:glycosyltransferase involved in cell wall biosynthesis